MYERYHIISKDGRLTNFQQRRVHTQIPEEEIDSRGRNRFLSSVRDASSAPAEEGAATKESDRLLHWF